jgi:hypothetical protein
MAARDDFLRRYATSPIHVPRLERFLARYGDDERADAFCARFIAWDRACPDGEAARIVAEVLSDVGAGPPDGPFSDEVVQGAIRWMGEVATLDVTRRAAMLREAVTSVGERRKGG